MRAAEGWMGRGLSQSAILRVSLLFLASGSLCCASDGSGMRRLVSSSILRQTTAFQESDWKQIEGLSLGRTGKAFSVSGPVEIPQKDVSRKKWRRNGITEWLVNGKEGMEYGLTVVEKPAGANGELSLELRQRGEVVANHDAGAGVISNHPAQGDPALRHRNLVAVDARGRRLPARMPEAGDTVRRLVDDQMAGYPIVAYPMAQQTFLKMSNMGGDDEFGAGAQSDKSLEGARASEAFVDGPQVTIISPSSGSLAGGQSVTSDGAAATSFTLVNATTITATTPEGIAGTASAQARMPDGTNAANTLYTDVAGSVAISPLSDTATAAGQTGKSITVTASASRAGWTATSNSSWLTVTAGSSATGSGTVAYHVAANTSANSRTGELTTGGQTLSVTQSGAMPTFGFASATATVPAAAGRGSIGVTVTPGDATWTAASDAAWLTVSPSPVTGAASLGYSFTANGTAATRTGTITVGGQSFTVIQVKEQQAILGVNPRSGANTVNLFDLLSESTTSTVSVGWAPMAVAVNPQGTNAYVVNCGSLCTASRGADDNSVSVVDLGSMQVKTTIPVGVNPIAIALNPAGTRAYVHNAQSATLSVIDTNNNTVIATVPSCGRGLVIHPTLPRLYLSCGRVIDTTTNTEITTIAGVAGPDIAIHPNGSFVYIATDGATENTPGRVSVISTDTNAVATTIPVGNSPFSIAVHPGGTRAYVANSNSGSISSVDLVTNSLFATIAVGGNPRAVAVSPDGQRIYVAKGFEANVVVIDAADHANLGELPFSADEFTLLQTGIQPPGAPRGVSAVAEERHANVSFQPPVSTGGAGVTGYSVMASPGSITATGSRSPVTVSGLTPGVAYQFGVRAVNLVGAGPSSALSNSVMPGGVAFPFRTATVPATAGAGSVAVTTTPSNIVWTPTSSAPWLTVASTAITGSATLKYSYSANGNVAPRAATIMIGGQTFTVIQSGITGSLTLPPTTDTATATGATGKTVAATSNAAWLTVTAGASPTGSATVTYTVAANTSVNSRTGTLTIGGQTFTVTQSGMTPTYAFGSATATIPATAGSGNVSVTVTPSDATWTPTSSAAWLTLSSASVTGSATLSYNYTANGNAATRTGTITVGGQTFTVTQSGVTGSVTLSTTTDTAPAAGISGRRITVGVTSSASFWTAESQTPWITVTAGFSGTGNGEVVYSVSPNSSATSRTGTLIIGGMSVTVTQAGTAGAQPVSVTPAAGSSGRQLFSYTVRHSASANNVLYAQFLFSRSGLVAQNGCYVSYDPLGNVFYLLNDNATEWFGLYGGSSGTVGNSQCTVHGATSGSSRAGSDLTISLDASFRTGFAGAKRMYLLSGDNTGLISDWQEVGAWSDTGDRRAVELISLTPDNGSGGAVTLTSIVRDSDGANTIPFTQLVMNAGLNGFNACFIHYDRASNVFFLLKDDGSDWFGLRAGPGTAGQVANSQCVLRAAGSGGTASGDTLTVTYNLQFKGGFTGSRQIYLQVLDDTGVIQTWRQMGSWTVSGATLSSAGGSSVSSRGGSGQGFKEPPGGLVFETPRRYRVMQRGNVWLVGAEEGDAASPGVTQQQRRNRVVP